MIKLIYLMSTLALMAGCTCEVCNLNTKLVCKDGFLYAEKYTKDGKLYKTEPARDGAQGKYQTCGKKDEAPL